MDIIRGINQIKKYPRPVVAIGMFDGVHRGHTRIITECVRAARRIKGTAVMLTFWPHPQDEDSIYSLDHRLSIMESLGIQACILIRFSRGFSGMSPELFVTRIICARIGAAAIFVGENFRFGAGLTGTVESLAAHAGRCGYRLKVFSLAKYRGRVLSSTRIRGAIASGRLDDAARMLGRRVSIRGTVIGGRRVARRMGYPTANIRPQHEVVPPDGIYAVTAVVGGREIPGICYKGIRPTFAGRKNAPCVEVHLFKFAGDLYGSQIEVRFFGKIRNQKKFPSPAALAAAIKKDILTAKEILCPGRRNLFPRHNKETGD